MRARLRPKAGSPGLKFEPVPWRARLYFEGSPCDYPASEPFHWAPAQNGVTTTAGPVTFPPQLGRRGWCRFDAVRVEGGPAHQTIDLELQAPLEADRTGDYMRQGTLLARVVAGTVVVYLAPELAL